MSQALIAQKQTKLAKQAVKYPAYRFKNLYDLLHWDKWIDTAARNVLSRKGSTTSGIDKISRAGFKDNYDYQIKKIVKDLKSGNFQPQSVRRVYIPKPNGKRRPLGIPTLRDRVVQEAMRMILDPIYESDFQPYSFGFRKGRRTMDATVVLMQLFNKNMKRYYIIEGDLKSYFDTVNHRKLLSILKQRIADKKLLALIHKFLKAGVLEHGLFAKTETGVPQGGVISPLLANVYLNEFDKWAEEKWHLKSPGQKSWNRQKGGGTYTMIRYADDFVIVTNDTIAGVRKAKAEVKEFLEKELLLTLSEEKTKITHLNDGIDFLGFHFRRYKPEGRWVVHLKPAAKSIAKVKAKIKALTKRNTTYLPETTRLQNLNAVVSGWSEYYKYIVPFKPVEDISRYTWHRYHLWLLKKQKGSRKRRLVKQYTKKILGRERWVVELKQGEKVERVYQWQPTRRELNRTKYRQKGRNGFPHPYLKPVVDDGQYLKGNKGVDKSIFRVVTGQRLNAPLDFPETRLQALLRDSMCVKCGAKDELEVHHKKGLKSNKLKDLVTLCKSCHLSMHGKESKGI